jgi:hypothetical protein
MLIKNATMTQIILEFVALSVVYLVCGLQKGKYISIPQA